MVYAAVIDTHCHLDVAAFDDDREAVLDRAVAAGVRRVIVPAIRPSTWQKLIAWARARSAVAIAIGVHPQVVPALALVERRSIDQLARAAIDAGAIAIGECGLDGATGDHEEQERILRLHIRAAREARLPLIVHVLRAHDAAPRILEEERAHEVGGVLHSYSGGRALVGRYVDLGFHISFAGPVSWPGARRPLEAARVVPRERLLAETDAPDQSPEPHRGGRCEPAFVVEVIAAIARARGEDPAEVAAFTSANASRLFSLP